MTSTTIRTMDKRPREWRKVTARVYYRDNTSRYITFTVSALKDSTSKDLADYVEKTFAKIYWSGEEYPHGGTVKFKIISCAGQKVNRIIE